MDIRMKKKKKLLYQKPELCIISTSDQMYCSTGSLANQANSDEGGSCDNYGANTFTKTCTNGLSPGLMCLPGNGNAVTCSYGTSAIGACYVGHTKEDSGSTCFIGNVPTAQ
ncbi:MAG TPA: hypothetical protein QF753_18460 [Victivallales bacterium]|nr:hypothetical protein [Victivallales bacterium]